MTNTQKTMKKMLFRAVAGSALSVASLLSAPPVQAQDAGPSLTEMRAARHKRAEEVKVMIACGKADKENCAIVVPEINARTLSGGVRVQPLLSQGSVESMDGLCAGDVNMAIVQADVYVNRSGQSDCQGLTAVVGSPLYPYYGFAVARADNPRDGFADMATNLPVSSALEVAAGGSGSGGEATLRTVLSANPGWKQATDIQPDGSVTALNKVKDRQLNVFFVMDGPQSPLLKQVTQDVNPQSKQPNFKFIDFTPNDALLNMTYNNGQKLYATAQVVPSGFLWTGGRSSIATPAILVVRNDFYDAQAATVGRIRDASIDALPAIAAKAGAPKDWAKDFAPAPN